MKIYLYNSLTRTKEEFQPLKKNQAGLYTCGPTVYDTPHIGNLLSYIIWDILKRFLLSQKYKVKHIMNLTDVGHLTSDSDTGEDKLEKAKTREGQTAWDIAQKYIKIFKENITSLNILPPTKYLRATETIKEQIDFVKILEKKGFLYKTSDGLYFDTSKIKDYGRLRGLDKIQMQEGARVEKNPEKKNPADFAVWKFSPKDQKRDMEWESPWGVGFPGWHLECSVMSRLELGDTFDIHTGGEDHLPIHHPNEMAQSQAVTGKIQANYWLHNAFLKFDGGKMAKSSGGFITLDNLLQKGYRPAVFRYLVLQNHYRTPLNFTWESIDSAKAGLSSIIKNLAFSQDKNKVDQKLLDEFYSALSDDLNTAKALAVMQKSQSPKTIYEMDKVLGLDLQKLVKQALDIPLAAQKILKQRAQARKNKDFKLSDSLRQELANMGVEVQDTASGQKAIKL